MLSALSSIWTWATQQLQALGLYGKSARILFLGLDNAGKTTLMHMLSSNRLIQHKPTHHATREQMQLDGITFDTIDLGGHREARRIWQDYYPAIDGIIFMIDAAEPDPARILEAKDAFIETLFETQKSDVPVLVLANKIDMDGARSLPQVLEVFGLVTTGRHHGKGRVQRGQVRPLEVFMCSVANREGYKEGIRWLASYL
jgi:GTP-binding protein SAR1